MSDSKKKKNGSPVKFLIIGLILVALVAGYYYYLSNIKTKKTEETVVSSAVTELLLHNYDISYPPSPKEVVKEYSEYSRCFYGESYSDEELAELARKSRMLLDDELVAQQSDAEYLDALRIEIKNMQEQSLIISSYATSAAADVDYFSADGFNFAKLYCVYTLRSGTNMTSTSEVYLLRKDSDGHWKIYGWQVADEENTK